MAPTALQLENRKKLVRFLENFDYDNFSEREMGSYETCLLGRFCHSHPEVGGYDGYINVRYKSETFFGGNKVETLLLMDRFFLITLHPKDEMVRAFRELWNMPEDRSDELDYSARELQHQVVTA